MRNTNKKGFTIVELVVVVAVIAILAAVLIPVFNGVIRRANVAKDNQLIAHLNKALAADVDGDHNFPTDAFAAADKFGYDIAKIDAKASGNKILWDSVNDVFCYYNSKNDKIEYINKPKTAVNNKADYWVISATVDDTYSTYLYGCQEQNVTAIHNLDTGDCAVNVTYDKAGSVKIRTNGGTLTVNNPSAEVAHYGEVYLADIQAVAGNSYHEHGVAQSIVVKSGRVVIENNATVKILDVSAADAGVKIDAAETAVVTNVVANEDADAVTFTGAAVEDTSKHINKTTVANINELNAAIADASVKYIVFADNISTSAPVQIDRSLILDGNGKKLINTATGQTRGIHVGGDKVDYVDVAIKNLTIDILNSSSGNSRGINIWMNDYVRKSVDLSLENCKINIPNSSSYGINVPENVLANINIVNTDITAWGALNVIGVPGTKIVVNGGTLTGVNKLTGGSNNFAVIVAEGNTTKDDANDVLNSAGLDIQISNTKIVAKATASCNEYFAIFNPKATLNKITFVNCKFVAEGENAGGYMNNGAADNICTVDGKQVDYK